MTTSGRVASWCSDPRSCAIQPPGDPKPPAIAFGPLTADQYAGILAAWGAGLPVTVEGEAPACVKVSG